jgi:hypothetical protein
LIAAPGKAYDISIRYRYRGKHSPRQTFTVTAPADLDATNAASIDGQGALATLSTVDYSRMVAPGSSNLLYAAAFEDTAAWSGGGAFDTGPETTGGLGVPRSRYFNGVGAPAGKDWEFNPVASVYPAVSPGDAIYFYLRSWIKSGWTGRIRLRCEWYAQDKATLVGSSVTIATGADYRTVARVGDVSEELRGVAVAPAGAAFLRIRPEVVMSSTLTNAGAAYIGALQAFRCAQTGRLLVNDAGAVLGQGAVVTAEGTAAAVAGQSPLATQTPPTHAGNAAALTAGLLPGAAFLDSSDGNKLKAVVSAGSLLAVSLNRYSQTKTRSGSGTVTSDAYTATVTGGSGSYEYAWTQYYGDALSAISGPTSSSTTFSFSLATGQTKHAKIQLIVRDTTNNTSASVVATFTGSEVS